MNRTLFELVRTSLLHKNVSNQFWAEWILSEAYIRNRVTSRSIYSGKTPCELWHSRLPNFKHVRIFESRCYYTIPRKGLQKHDRSSQESIIIIYAEYSKAYKLWDCEKRLSSYHEMLCSMKIAQKSELEVPIGTWKFSCVARILRRFFK